MSVVATEKWSDIVTAGARDEALVVEKVDKKAVSLAGVKDFDSAVRTVHLSVA